MAYNVLSGTVYLPGELLSEGQVSSSNFVGDGQNLSNVIRITSNPTNNYLLTVGANANSIVGEPNLIFNGTTLTLAGNLTASVGISASYFQGDGSQLANIATSPGGSSGSIQVNDGSSFVGNTNLVFTNRVLQVSGGLTHARRYLAANATASLTDYYIGINSTGGTVDFFLLNAASCSSGQTYVIKDEGGAANTNNITIRASGSQTIDGENSIVLESSYTAISLYCNGVDKYFIY
tara:strand:- start:3748 stop:4452 length:705 start_codon:yes stop_codon:yes gene_type:complete